MSEQIRKFYSSKAMAMIMGSGYSRQEKQDVFLHQDNIGTDQYEYSLRFREEIIKPESNEILRHWQYTPPNQLKVVAEKKPPRRANGVDGNIPCGLADHPNAPYNDEPELKICPHCNGEKVETTDPHSNCCGAQFTYPGYPDSDVCDDCKEHAALTDCHLCEGKGEVLPEVYDDYKAEAKFDHEANQ